MSRSVGEMHDAQEQARELAARIAELLNEMDRIVPGMTAIGAGRISGPGLEIRRVAGTFAVRS